MEVFYFKKSVYVYIKKNLKNKKNPNKFISNKISDDLFTLTLISNSKVNINRIRCKNFFKNWLICMKYGISRWEKEKNGFKIFKFIDKIKTINDLCVSFQLELKWYTPKIAVQCKRLVQFTTSYKHFIEPMVKFKKQSIVQKVKIKTIVNKNMKLINNINSNSPDIMLLQELTSFLIFFSGKKIFFICMSRFYNFKKKSYILCKGTKLIILKKKKFLIHKSYKSLISLQDNFLIERQTGNPLYKNWYSSKVLISYSNFKYYKNFLSKKGLLSNSFNLKSSEENIDRFKTLYFTFNLFFKSSEPFNPEKVETSSHLSVCFRKFFFFEQQTVFVWRLINLKRLFVLFFQNFKLKKGLKNYNLNLIFKGIRRDLSLPFFSTHNQKQNQRNFMVLLIILINKMYILKKLCFLNVFIFRQFSYFILIFGYFVVHPRTLGIKNYILILIKYWIMISKLTKILSTLKFN